jgi:hypothetical protein
MSNRHLLGLSISLGETVAAASAAGAVAIVADDWLAGAAVLVLLAGLKLTSTEDGMFVLPAAYAFHWSQTSIGLIYKGVFGREVVAIQESDYRPMVLLALGCCLAIAVGVRVGVRLIAAPHAGEDRPGFAFSMTLLAVVYGVGLAFEGTLAAIAPNYPSVRQIIVTMDLARLGALFLIFRRLLHPEPRWLAFGAILAVEIVLGITGFFAGFREPVILAALATMEIFDRRNLRHWAAMAGAGAAAVALGLIWMGVRVDYRRDYVSIDTLQASRSARVELIGSLASQFFDSDAERFWATADRLVDRMWTIYYPALALKRVPDMIAHTDGAIFGAALVHIVTPRIFFPDKPELPSDSDEVRKYAGVMVAGREQNTSIAFGYSAESYIDFGVPLMFLPVLGFGLALGVLYAWFRKSIWHHELFVGYGTVAFWLSLYLFERSWATMLGVTLGFMVYLGVPVILLDRFLLIRFARRRERMRVHVMPGPSWRTP